MPLHSPLLANTAPAVPVKCRDKSVAARDRPVTLLGASVLRLPSIVPTVALPVPAVASSGSLPTHLHQSAVQEHSRPSEQPEQPFSTAAVVIRHWLRNHNLERVGSD